jgi:tetratricopeptide (TPR) repeat protein
MILALWLALARADDTDEDPVDDHGLPALPDVIPTPDVPAPKGTITGTEYSDAVYRGAAALKLEPSYVDALHKGLEKIYVRDYKGARDHFVAVEAAHPGPGVDAVADVLVWQALMFENYDFKYEKQWSVASKRARTKLGAALAIPGDDAWEHFLMAGVVGIEAIHTLRKEQYLGTLSLAFEAMDNAAKAQAEAPEFVDLLLCDGMYNYWRTIITGESKLLPDFGDHRAEGIGQMQAVAEHGIFLDDATHLSLAFVWIQEHRLDKAIDACETNRTKYPDNVINNLLTGRTYISLRKFDTAIGIFDHVLAVAPDNKYVHYYEGVAQLRSGKLSEAQASLDTFLAFPDLETWQRSYGLYRRGQLAYKEKKYDDAEQDWEQAIKIDGNGPAKARLEKLKDAKKTGSLPI